MKRLLLFFAMIPFLGLAQITDNFSDGDFTANPAWNGDNSQYIVNASQQLQLNSTGAATSYLALTTSMPTLDNTAWQFYIKLNFAPSSSNYSRVYLVSDQQNLKGALNGYYVQFGETGSNDAIEIFKQTGTTSVSVARGTNGFIAAASTISVKITRDNAGLWSIYADASAGTNFTLQSSGTDATINSGNYFGVSCTYTSSNATGFYFDDFSIPYIADVTPPTLTSAIPLTNTALDVKFSEPIDLNTAQTTTNYSVQGLGVPSTAARDISDFSLVHLTFSTPFNNGTAYTLAVSNISDLNSNVITAGSTTGFTWNAPVTAQAFDVVINEIYFEPIVSAPLPNAEFVELYNRSNKILSLNGWTLSDGSTSVASIGAVTLLPGTYIIICKNSDTTSFIPYGNTTGTSSFPSLNNDVGDDLRLTDNNGTLIDRVIFSDDNYNDDSKKTGGFTIERIDADFTCNSRFNWHASEDSQGGTPAKVNSVKGSISDTTPPQVLDAYPLTTTLIRITFNENPDTVIAIQTSSYNIDNGIGQPASVILSDNHAFLTLSNALQTGIIYNVTLNALIADCPGNKITGNLSLRIGIAETAAAGDILINEILFNPKTGGNDFVELYNNSSKIIDLKNIKVATTDDNNLITTNYTVSDNGYLLFPQAFIVLTSDVVSLQSIYANAIGNNLLKASLPGFNDDIGVCVITDFALNRIDQLNYNKRWHFPLIDDQNGVSLERIWFNKGTQDSTNWHSAAESVGYATPGYKNSQSLNEQLPVKDFAITPEVFSPDNDGYNDVITFSISMNEPGYILNAKIYNEAGMLVRNLVKSKLLAPEDSFSWDGITDKNDKASVGIYIVYAEAFNPEGKTKKYKKAFVVATKL
ncbi:MAG TPA: lamin tail domain-containing protein [Bacteroidia bacterium]|nr:lamin tail domain-containing protein [Bacteroidia bacterium]